MIGPWKAGSQMSWFLEPLDMDDASAFG